MQTTQPTTRIIGSRALIGYFLIAIVFLCLLISAGSGGATVDRIIAFWFILLNSSWIPILYLIGSLGVGRIARPWIYDHASRWVIELGIGLTLTLSLSHALGLMGWLHPINAWIITGGGCLLALTDLRNVPDKLDLLNHRVGQLAFSIPGACFVLGCVLVLAMSSNPPGASWDSEFGSYDALSYHLELPREWHELGSIWPSEHNVYSFLPGYFEAAYLHFAQLSNAPKATASGISGFMDSNARVLMSTQIFSAILLIVSALAIGRVTRQACKQLFPDADSSSPALCAQALMMCTPWMIVVGSLAYNEIGVVFLGICAFSIAIDQARSPSCRAMIAAVLVGGACSIKPTALFLLAPSVGVVLLASIPIKHWLKPILLGSLGGLVTLLPWLIRNHLASGSIVFPQGTSLFGLGHWSADQHALYQSAHQFSGSLLDRFMMLIVPDQTGSTHVSRFRGWTNLQWSLTPWFGLLGCITLVLNRRAHKAGVVIAIGLSLPIVAWMMLTHLQSRFLIPLIPLLIAPCVLALPLIRADRIRNQLIAGITLSTLAWATLLTLNQSLGNPFMLVDLGADVFTGELEVGNEPWTATLNNITEPSETIYLLGDATPFYLRSPNLYNTVYDRWLIEESIENSPGDPTSWTDDLVTQGVDIIVISFSEISRFSQSGWLPESIEPDALIHWIESLPEPIYVWHTPTGNAPIRAAYRLRKP